MHEYVCTCVVLCVHLCTYMVVNVSVCVQARDRLSVFLYGSVFFETRPLTESSVSSRDLPVSTHPVLGLYCPAWLL